MFIHLLRCNGVNKNNRFDLLFTKLKEYAFSPLIITDRLHGMIFAAIVGTPCIAIDNISHKVKNCYEWIKSLDYIHYCDNENELNLLLDHIDEIINKRGKYTLESNVEFFDLIKNQVLEKFNSK